MDGGRPTNFRFNPTTADEIFSEYFRSSSPKEGLKGQVPPPGAGGMDGDGPTTFRFNPRNADDVFSEFFGVSSPSGGTGDDRNATFRNLSVGKEGSSSGLQRKAAAIERMLTCSLEDLYKGTTKKMKISRDVTDSSGRSTTVVEMLTIETKPGWKKGTKITFPEKGNEQQGVIPSDLVFIIDEKPHNLFMRDDNDLIVTQKISLFDALTGYTARVTTLDGRNLTIPVTNIISPTYEEIVKGEGMPISKEPGKRGNLRIKFNIKFPTRLTSEQKLALRILQ